MDNFEVLTGLAVPLTRANIDTDAILPSRYLTRSSSQGKDGFGQFLFSDWRFDEAGRPRPEFVLNRPEYKGAKILVAGENIGCGSSREHAPQALMRWGIRAFVAESYAEIFFGNCVALGLPCFTAPAADLDRLMAAVETDPLQKLGLDVARQLLSWKGGEMSLTLPEGARRQFLEGTWDALGQLLERPDLIRATAEGLPYMNDFAIAL